MKIKQLLASAGLITFTVIFSFITIPAQVGASNFTDVCSGTWQFGRARCDGYFTGTSEYKSVPYGIQGYNILTVPAGKSWSIPSSVDTRQEFMDLIGGYLGCDYIALTCDGNYNYNYNKGGAAFIVDTMLGLKGSQLAGKGYSQSAFGGAHYAQDNWATWVADVTYYGSHGWISWNVSQTLGPGDLNSMHACNFSYNPATGCPENANGSMPSGDDSKDYAFFDIPPGTTEQSDEVVFNNPDGTKFRIRRECANLVGQAVPLQVPVATVNPSCGSLSVNPGRPDPKSAFSVTAAIDYANSNEASTVESKPDAVMKLSVVGPGINYTNNNIAKSQDSSEIDAISPSLGPSNITGTYNVAWSISSASLPSANEACTGSFIIADEPYFSVSSGDVSAGASMGVGGVDCATTADPNAGVVSWNKENSTYDGAGTQYAAFAMNFLQDFATAQGTASQVPTGLSFSNIDNVDTSGAGEDTYGGAFGSQSCVPDYFNNHPSSPTYSGNHVFNNGSDLAAANSSKTIYVQAGNLTIGGAIAVPNGSHTTIYVDGKVQITGNIQFSGNYPGGLADIPSFTIVARGNIYIASGVGQLDGWYIAEPDNSSNGGIVYTCASGFAAPSLSSTLFNNCNNQLQVNGSIVAKQVWLTRTAGTLYGNTPSENFSFNPEIWLSSPPGISIGSSSSSTYDAITSLPPTL